MVGLRVGPDGGNVPVACPRVFSCSLLVSGELPFAQVGSADLVVV